MEAGADQSKLVLHQRIFALNGTTTINHRLRSGLSKGLSISIVKVGTPLYGCALVEIDANAVVGFSLKESFVVGRRHRTTLTYSEEAGAINHWSSLLSSILSPFDSCLFLCYRISYSKQA